MICSHLCAVFLFFLCGVFGVDTDGLKSVSVMEGDSVTLHTNLTVIQRDDLIVWMFGPQETRIAEIYKQIIDMFDSNETFGDKLQLDYQTGSLIIRNITIKHSGLYKLLIISNRGTSYKRFSVTVYAPLPVPVIIRDSCQCSSSSESSSKCVLECSVVNVTQVTLSWYKGNSLFSSISVSDLNSSLSLPLEVEYQENNIYSCVVSNHIRNQTKHLNITEVCQTCPGFLRLSYLILLTLAAVVPVFISTCVICCGCRKCRKQGQEDQTIKVTEYTQIIYYSLQMTDLSQKSYEDVNRTVNAVTYQHTTQ
ncbi:natural killer cell receptor 2B4-like [Myxocyprinus asiaticus]|uniref:natural killer cell receptor 2B4-like n=1 Tax=Myxocyprinus asiaticus TaxID=70543 RepID=UPI0022228769|nr:natural killer cell receptor 2B4-like [Myxocyprinus asiaticus]